MPAGRVTDENGATPCFTGDKRGDSDDVLEATRPAPAGITHSAIFWYPDVIPHF
jgi:hypothetical protein